MQGNDLDTPTATVYGVDVSPVPAPHPSPPKSKRIIHISPLRSTLLPKTATRLARGPSDYIYQRLLSRYAESTNWVLHIRDMATLLQPGGLDGSVHEYAQSSVVQGRGWDVCSGERLEAMREAAGPGSGLWVG